MPGHFSFRLAAAAAAAVVGCHALSSAAQPNIVFIISDDAGWADFGFNDQGNGQVPTPALDSIAARGRWFRAAYTAPVCSPSRARIFLGQHGQRTGYDHNGPNSLDGSDSVVEGLRLEDVTMFERLNDAGYHVGYFGKWHLGTEQDQVVGNTVVAEGNLPPRHGIDYFLGLTSGSRTYFMGQTSSYSQLFREQTLNPATNLISDIVREGDYPVNAYFTDVLADEVADYITDRSQQPEPFFVTASFTAPHGPLQATSEYFARADALGLGLTGNRRTYTAMMIALDDGVQTILDRLDDPNSDGDTTDSILDETIICFINDNGGETANTARNFPLRGKKSDTFDGGIRVMMAIAGPGIPATGASFDHPVDSTDLMPTFLAAAGQPLGPDDFTDGVDLMPYLNGTITEPPHDVIFVRGNNPITTGLRAANWKLTIENIGGPFLYDILSNPGETNVLNSAFPEVVEDLKDAMIEFEVGYIKPRWGPTDVNQFDDFVWRAAQVGTGTWSQANAWTTPSGSPATATLFARDAVANFTATFPTRATPYTATNDQSRPSGLDFFANRLTFSGDYAGAGDSGVTLDSRALIMTATREGIAPAVMMDMTSQSTGAHPAKIDLQLRIWDDMEIAGTGTQVLELSGGMVEERAGRRVTKASSAPLRVTGFVELTDMFDLVEGASEVAGLGRIAAMPLMVREGASLTLSDAAGMTSQPDFIGNEAELSVVTPTSGPAPITLDYTGIEVVGSLLIDGVALGQGVYGAGSHPQIFQGPGRITIRGPLVGCPGDLNNDGFANTFDTLDYLWLFDAEAGCGGGGGPGLPSGVSVNTEAWVDTPGDGLWEVTAPGTDLSRGWSFGGSISPVDPAAGAPALFSKVYSFPEAAATGPDYEDPSRSPSTIELWIRPDDFAGSQMIWEAGGSGRGAAIWLQGDELRLDVLNGSPSVRRASTTLTSGWHHIVAVIDINSSTAGLYVDAQLRDSVNLQSTDRWAGGNPSGLGRVNSSAVGGITPDNFRGQIAVYRAYNTRALPQVDVQAAYNTVVLAGTPCDLTLDLNGDGELTASDVLQHLIDLGSCGE